MKLNLEDVTAAQELEGAGVKLPRFDVAKMQEEGVKNPRWVHFGSGNIFRVFHNRIADDMLADGLHWPITAVQPRDPEQTEIGLRQHDLLTLAVTLSNDGTDMRAIAGISELLASQEEKDFNRLVEIMENPEVTMVTFTITEKGYVVTDSHGELRGDVAEKLQDEPVSPHSDTMIDLTGLMLARFRAGGAPITLISCDNFSHNGDKLRESVLTVAEAWKESGKVDEDFVSWLTGDKVTFPISVIDKITPRPSAKVADSLEEIGFTDMGITEVARTPVAGFVATEPAEYLLIEDNFAADRPPLEKYGVYITDRETCDKFERMKVCTCLNPLHTALATAGVTLRFPTIDSEMRDDDLRAYVHRLAYKEALPVVTDPGIIAPEEFLREVLEVRFPNQALPDDPARIAMDTSQKIPIRFGETLKEYRKRDMDMAELVAIPLVFAVWCRYLLGVADDGEAFTPSSDPLLDELQAHLSEVRLGEEADVHAALEPILSNATIFGVDLYSTPLAEKVENLFTRMIAGPGAVRTTIHEEINR